MRKNIIPILLIAMFIITSTTYAFSDMEEHWAKEAIEEFEKVNIIKGYEDNTFRPDDYMTRAEVATVINRMIGATKESSKYIPDINRQDWYYAEIRKSVQAGIMQGDLEGYTNPNNNITREEVVTMISRAFYISKNSIIKGNYPDANEVSSWAQEAVNTFVDFGYIKGYENGTIRPKAFITRAEFITILNRVFSQIAVQGMYEENINGNLLIMGNNIVLKDITINGNLTIAEGVSKTIKINNINVKGNLVLREEMDTSQILVHGQKINAYERLDQELNKYTNNDYGIEFSISDKAKVVEKWIEKDINYKRENLVILEVEQKEEYYLKNIETIGKIKTREFDTIYQMAEKGEYNDIPYILYDDISEGAEHNYLVIKRDNTIYTLSFNNVSADNLVDNVLSTIKFLKCEKVVDREKVIYKNNKLNVKFIYRDGYIGVDDSYNTNNIYSGDAPLRLFIQANTITDINEYSLEEIEYLLKTLVAKDGKLLETKNMKVVNNDAIKFKVLTEENKIMYSLYVIIGNNLYDFIFSADEDVMNEVGDYFFAEIINSLEI